MGLLDNTTQKAYYTGNNFGNYQFTSLEDIINQFMVAYVGEEKIISKARRIDVAFHAQRALRELSFDTFKSIKSQEIELPPSLTMPLPHDYINYTRVLWSDSSGIKHPIYPTKHTQNPFKVKQDSEGNYEFVATSGALLIENPDFEQSLALPWVKTPAADNTALGLATVANVGAEVDAVGLVSGALSFTSLPFEFTNNLGTHTTGRAYAVWQPITVTNIDTLDITATGTSAAEESGKSSGGVLRIGISSTPGDMNTNVKKNIPSTNDVILSGASEGPNFLPGTNSSTSNSSFPNANTNNEVLEWNNSAGETDIEKTLHNIDVTEYDTVYLLITSYTTFTALDAAKSTNSIDDISGFAEGSSPSLVRDGDSTTWTNYKSNTPSENTINDYNYDTDIYDLNLGQRYGVDPQHAQVNGSFFIDNLKGNIHFSSNVSGKTVVLDYISDSLGTDEEMQVHKFAEEAMYKWIAYAVLSTRANIPEYIVRRYQKDKFAATRQAKLRLSNIKLEEITQILRGKSKHIKH